MSWSWVVPFTCWVFLLMNIMVARSEMPIGDKLRVQYLNIRIMVLLLFAYAGYMLAAFITSVL